MLKYSLLRRLNGAIAVALAMTPLAVGAMVQPARAAELDQSRTGVSEQGQSLRLGLNKSAVIRLPANVKDVLVGNPGLVDVVVRTKNTAYLFARAAGQTNVFFLDDKGKQILSLDVEVTLDMGALQKLLDRSIPGSRISVDTIGENVVLNGTAANAVEAKLAEDMAAKFAMSPDKVVNALTIAGGDQVMLKVRVVEVKRDVVKQLGINLDRLAFSAGKFAFNLATSNGIAGSPALTAGSSFSSGNLNMKASLEALENEGVLRTLAEPTLTAISGQPAMFHAGGEFDAGNACTGSSGSSNNGSGTFTGGSCGPVFKPFGVTLAFTPVVLSEGRISLKIATSISELDPQNSTSSSRALSTRNAETTLELPSGGSMMLAGLIKDVSTQAINGTPGLKNLPILGALFRSRAFQANQTELVVIVTPYIVNSVGEKQLATPADGFNVATDRQAILFGRLNRIYGAPGRNPEGVYHGSVGYIIE
ncbi:MAG: type II and III secretion system protein family protein [Rhizobiales bacterium]|nr:type II and III secretion system protein family protein [Hyphomicrobiales bacterium]